MRKAIWMGAAFLAMSAPFGALAQQQAPPPPPPPQQESLADAARKAREEKEKKSQTKPAKVFTNENIPYDVHINVVGNTPASLTAPGDTKPGTQPAKTDASAQAAPEKKDEAYWRKRFADERKKLDMATKELDIMQRELNLSQTQYYSDPNKAMNEQLNRKEINDKTAAIEKKKKEIEAIKQEIDDLETEMKRAGGDPGWAR